MKLLVKKFFASQLSTIIKNNLNYKIVSFNIKKLKNASVSDAFLWRTDNNFSTIFKFNDLLKFLFKIDKSYVEIIFYDKNNKKIKQIIINKINYSNELLIDSEFLDGLEDYGCFYIYHFTNQKTDINSILSNRCYLGYSKMNSIFSFVHGNGYARFKKINEQIAENTNIVNTTFIKSHSYTIQKYFGCFEKHELFFTNPTSKIINFSIENKKFFLKSGSTILVKIIKKEKVEIISNCLFFRPTVFSFNNNYFDVHHT